MVRGGPRSKPGPGGWGARLGPEGVQVLPFRGVISGVLEGGSEEVRETLKSTSLEIVVMAAQRYECT